MTGQGIRSVRFVHIFTVLALLVSGVPALAQPVPPSCDADYWTVMGARANLGVAREMEAAQRIIRKPDSTLEYTCFGLEVLDHMALATNALFSDDQDVNSMDSALDGLVLVPMNRYLDQNFWHVYLGGAFPGFGGGPAICDAMAQVWMAAKCQDFDFGFLMFEEMPGNDPRTLPTACGPPAARQAYMDAMIAAAYPLPGAVGGMDVLDTYQPEMSQCATPPIETGVVITLTTGAPFNEAICIAPGCYHDGTGTCVP